MKSKTPKTTVTRGKYATAFKKGVNIVVHTRKGDRVRKLKRNPDGSFTWGTPRDQATG